MKNKIYQIVAIIAIVVYALASCTPRENPDVSKNTQKMYDSIYVYNTNNGEDFYLDRRDYYKYDSQGNQIEFLEESDDAGMNFKIERQFDTKGNMLEEIEYKAQGVNGTDYILTKHSKQEYLYNVQNQLVEIRLYRFYTDTECQQIGKAEYTYSADGRRRDYVSYDFAYPNDYFKGFIIMNDMNDPIETADSTFFKDSFLSVRHRLLEWEYDKYENPVYKKITTYILGNNSAETEEVEKNAYTYDDKGNILTRLEEYQYIKSADSQDEHKRITKYVYFY